MRRRRARLLAILTGVAVVGLSVGFAILRGADAPPVDGARSSPGAEVYVRLGCPACHAFRGTGNPSRPLDGVGGRLSQDAIRTWIVAPQRMKPGVRKPAYDDVPDADVDAVVGYLCQP